MLDTLYGWGLGRLERHGVCIDGRMGDTFLGPGGASATSATKNVHICLMEKYMTPTALI